MKTSVVILAAALIGGVSVPAVAQGVDCTAAVDATDYYCNHRDQFDRPAAAPATAPAPMPMATEAPAPRRAAHGSRHAMHPAKHHMTHSG